jgi:hypothetical protein
MTTTLLTRFKTLFITNPKLLFFPALFVGILILVLSIALKPKLSISVADDIARAVDVIPLQLTNTAPQITGFGQVRPKQQWSAIAEITGEVLYKSPLLAKGEYILAGTELLRIDPLKYKLALAQAEADLNSNQLQLEKLKQEQINLAKNLEIEKVRLALQEKENKRLSRLTKQGVLPQSDLDTQRINLLTQEKIVQELDQQLALFENEKAVAIAKINLSTASVAEANRSIAKTVIKAPHNIKVAQVDVEINQVVNLNQVMLVGHSLEVMEVEAQVAIHDMHTLISTLLPSMQDCSDCGVTPEVLNKIEASIELNSGNMSQTWPAKVQRISETIDVNQATVGVILEITQDPSKLRPGRPPLLNGMFIKASLTGQESPQFSVPEKVLHTNRIYLMDESNKLKIVPVTVQYRNHDDAVISGPISEGDKLVLNDLLPAIEGMSLTFNNLDAESEKGTAQ